MNKIANWLLLTGLTAFAFVGLSFGLTGASPFVVVISYLCSLYFLFAIPVSLVLYVVALIINKTRPTTPTALSDIYEQISSLTHHLRQAGFATQAEEIETCIVAGGTSLEILMCLRYNLKALLRARHTQPPQAIREEARKIVKQIGRLL